MTNYTDIDFSPILAMTEGEVVTHSRVRDIRLASGKVLALITLDNGRDHNRPNTLGPATLAELDATLEALKARAAAGEIQAVGVTGKQYILAAGADLSDISKRRLEGEREAGGAVRAHGARQAVRARHPVVRVRERPRARAAGSRSL